MTIQQLSQETSIGVDTLRIWERRYGTPAPARDARGHRFYTSAQAEELRVVKKLQNFGQRPGKIFALSPQQRLELLDSLFSDQLPDDERQRQLIEKMSPQQIAAELSRQQTRHGLKAFIHEYVTPLLQRLDHGWTTGQLSIAREHLIADQLVDLLKREIANMTKADPPQIVFLTLCGERHKIGLLLAAALFQQAGIPVFYISEELPLSEIPPLSTSLGVSAVALSFSNHYGPRQAKQDIGSLRKNLEPQIRIIAGGSAVQQMNSHSNVLICTDLKQIPHLIQRYFMNTPGQEQT